MMSGSGLETLILPKHSHSHSKSSLLKSFPLKWNHLLNPDSQLSETGSSHFYLFLEAEEKKNNLFPGQKIFFFFGPQEKKTRKE